MSVRNVGTLIIRRDEGTGKLAPLFDDLLKNSVTSSKSKTTRNAVQIFLLRLKKVGSATLRLSVPA